MDAKYLLGEPRLLISRKALLHNARLIRRRLAAGTKVCAILKADAYGHGAAAVADALCNFALDAPGPRAPGGDPDAPAVDAVAVASIDEAAALPPDVEQRVPVIVFRPMENAFLGRQRYKIEEAVRNGRVLTLCSAGGAADLARVAVACGRRALVQVMVDTGMTRSGVAVGQLDALLHKIHSRSALRLTGLCTHFACGEDASSSFTGEQFDRFTRATDAYADYAHDRRLGLVRHAANSGAIFFSPQSQLDMVRPGISLYGIDPTGRPCMDRALRPVMKWTAPLVGIDDIAQGATVGYGQAWTAPRPTRIGLVPVGYADGYPRSLSNRAAMLVQGRPAPVVGRVSMDLTTVDLTDVPQAVVGEEVIVLDCDPYSPASVYELARCADTIPYEIFARIGPRVKRVPVDEDDAPREPRSKPALTPDLV